MNYTKDFIIEKLKVFNDDKFVFNEEEHLYRYDGELMRGCTGFLENFIKPFDSEYWAQKKADDRGITKEEILKEWDTIRDRSCDLGSMVHNYIEDFYEKHNEQRTEELTDDEEANERIREWFNIYDSKLNIFESVGSEIRVFSKKYNLAGTIDKLFLYDGMLIIGDWKTNKKIKVDSDFAFGKLLFPFEHMKENELNKYSLQLSIYALILQEAGLDVSSMFLCHIPHEGECKIYKCKDLRADLDNYLMNSLILSESINIEEEKKKIRVEKIW